MNYLYLKINGEMIWGTNNLTREDLIRRRSGSYDAIINLSDMTYYDPENNTWKPIEGDK